MAFESYLNKDFFKEDYLEENNHLLLYQKEYNSLTR